MLGPSSPPPPRTPPPRASPRPPCSLSLGSLPSAMRDPREQKMSGRSMLGPSSPPPPPRTPPPPDPQPLPDPGSCVWTPPSPVFLFILAILGLVVTAGLDLQCLPRQARVSWQ